MNAWLAIATRGTPDMEVDKLSVGSGCVTHFREFDVYSARVIPTALM